MFVILFPMLMHHIQPSAPELKLPVFVEPIRELVPRPEERFMGDLNVVFPANEETFFYKFLQDGLHPLTIKLPP